MFNDTQSGQLINYIMSLPNLPPHFQQIRSVGLIEIKQQDGENALIPTPITVVSTAKNTWGEEENTMRSSFMFICRRDMTKPQSIFETAAFLEQLIMIINADQKKRNTASRNPKLPRFGIEDKREVIAASGGDIQNRYENGLADFQTQINIDYIKMYDNKGNELI